MGEALMEQIAGQAAMTGIIKQRCLDWALAIR
jgi:hypothetical protein